MWWELTHQIYSSKGIITAIMLTYFDNSEQLFTP